jgi:SnoaL-like domain
MLKALRSPRASSEAVDRSLIAERIYRYGWAYDERDRSLFGDCFSEDAVWEGSVMGQESVGPFAGRDAIVEWNTDFWKVQNDQRRHVFTNVIIDDLTDTYAVAHAYLLLTSSSNSKMTPVTTGPYRLQLVKQDDGWRIRHLTSSFDAPF